MNNDTYGVNWVTGERLSALTGLTVKALDRKRQRGIWREGVEYRKMDGGIYYSISAYNEWVANRTIRGSSSTAVFSAFRSRTKVRDAGSY